VLINRRHRHPAALLLCLCLAAPLSAQEWRDIERLFRGGETALALQRAEAAIAERPRDASMRFLRGVMLSETKREAEAMESFTRLTEDFPDLPEPYNNLAVLYAAQGKIDKARELLETALRHDPSYFTAHENLGDVFIRLARRAYERAAASGRSDAELERKLKLTRQLTPAGP
jgi:Flp pilus assembly protein TadD